MSDELNLVSDLALILISAGIITLIVKLLKQPLVLGYIIAGFIIGPNFDLFPTVINQANVEQWSEIGIIFLLFALGLEFSFKKLLQMGSSAFIAASIEIIAMICIGFLAGYFLKWSPMESIFLGGMLAMSSTTIIIKAFDDLGLKKQKFADFTLVILIIQDLVAIVMMVLLSTAAATQKFAGMEMLNSVLKLSFFLILWFVVGISVIPTFFRKTKKYVNDETLLIISIGLCFGMVAFANYVGFSSALGAFVMGSILCETIEGERIENLIKGIKDLFGAVFFVSVGMMVNPHILLEYWGTILILTLITLFVKAFISSSGVLISGQSLKVSIKTGFSLAQIGEFAFIIAALGVSLGVMKNFIYPVIVAVSVITTFTTPYFIRLANPFYNRLYKKLPQKTKLRLDNYQIHEKQKEEINDWKIILKISFLRIIVFSVISVAAILVSFQYLYPFVLAQLTDTVPVFVCNLIDASITLIAISPFLYGLMINTSSTKNSYNRLWSKSRWNRTVILSWTIIRVFIAIFFVIVILSKSFKFTGFMAFFIALGIVIFILIFRKTLHHPSSIEDNFFTNLNAKNISETQKKEKDLEK